MAEGQRSATPAPAGGRPQHWLPERVERVDEIPATLAHDIVDAALEIVSANRSCGMLSVTAKAVHALALLVEQGVEAGVMRWVEDPTR